MISGRAFVRRNEFLGVITIIVALILLLCTRENMVVADVPPVPSPVVINPQPVTPVQPTPVTPRPSPVTPCPCPRRCHWQRPDYVPGQPVRNVIRFIFSPRIQC